MWSNQTNEISRRCISNPFLKIDTPGSHIFVSTGCKSFSQPFILFNKVYFMTSADNDLLILEYNTKDRTFGDTITVKTGIDAFEIQNCKFTVDPRHGKIQFIVNIVGDYTFMVLDMQTNTLSKNGTCNLERGNVAHIEWDCFNKTDKVYVIGAPEPDKNEHKSEKSHFIHLPYDDALQSNGTGNKECLIREFGDCAQSLTILIDEKPHLLVMGGQTTSNDLLVPTQAIWSYNLSESNKSKRWKEMRLRRRMKDFGVVNYQNKYIFVFGGIRWSKREKEYVYEDKIECLDLKKNKWISLKKKLPKKSAYFALIIGESVHLFTWNAKHFTVEIEDIIREMKDVDENDTRLTMSWNELGKSMAPSKALSIKNQGPKLPDGYVDSDDESDEDEG